ncbi:MAG: hypothetical protein AB7P94_16890 [Steroidobacteraceae bacterium]
MPSLKISELTAAAALTGVELVEVSQLSATVRRTATTISAQNSDNSFNDSANGFLTAGFAVGDSVNVAGFTGNVVNNITSGRVTAVTAGKLTIGGADGNVIVDDAAGESVTIAKWVTRRTSVGDMADVPGGTLGGLDDVDTAGALNGDVLTFDSGDSTWKAIPPTGGGGGGGGGDVSGPASATDNTLPRFNGSTGKIIQASGVLVSDGDEISGYKGHINAQTGTSYTLQASDTGKVVELTNAAAITVTMPNSLAVGFCCTIVQGGAGAVTLTPASGATRRNRYSHAKTSGQWAMATLYVRTNAGGAAAEYVLGGDTAA